MVDRSVSSSKSDSPTSHANRAADCIYLDNQATTACDPRVVEAMLPFFTERFGNPHSVSHSFGWDAEEAVERARNEMARLIGAEAREIVFTSGATEANNLAIKGAYRFHREQRPHLVTLASEHKCVLESIRAMEREGADVTILQPLSNGMVDLEALAEAVTERTALVSIMAANNEIGVIQPLAEIGDICRKMGAYFHCDAAQAVGKIPLDVQAMKIDLLSVSGHKFYGPKGIGALYVRRRPRARLLPLMDGGGQERGLRSGTLAPPLCVGLGEAARLAREEMESDDLRIKDLRDRFLAGLQESLAGVRLHGDRHQRLSGNLNISFDGVLAEDLIKAEPRLAMSTGSACTSASVEPSYVLTALGLDDATANGAVRIAFGRFSTEGEMQHALALLVVAVQSLRQKERAAE
ncbi:cysteine desulfurase family protein [Rhodovibrionaceae bacterium A322]